MNDSQDFQTVEDETDAVRRRWFMKGALAAVGGAVAAGTVAEPAAAANGKPVLLGTANAASATTAVTTSAGSGVYGHSTAAGGIGVRGVAESGTGVTGQTSKAGAAGVQGTNSNTTAGSQGFGVRGISAHGEGVRGESADTQGKGVSGRNNATTGGIGTYGYAAGSGGFGVYGEATSSGVGTAGVYGKGVTGVLGESASAGHGGVFGRNTSGSGGPGVYGTSSNADGVSGFSSGGAGNGVHGEGWQGVLGHSSAATGKGVSGRNTASDGGIGTYGYATGSGGFGLYGDAAVGGTGVFGQGGVGVSGRTLSGGYGVYGESAHAGGHGVNGNDATGDGYGVYAASAGTGWSNPPGAGGWALHAEGDTKLTGHLSVGNSVLMSNNLTVAGSVSKGGGSFKIDHPLDPANKYLYHSFVESPDMMNVYNGVVELDRDGAATVTLPDWFEALNSDYRYQLTPIGGAAPDLHIASEIAERSFSIAGGRSGIKVSWQVTGIRRDRWAEAHRIPVEEDKPAQERGRYLHPDLIGDGAKGLSDA